MYNVPLTNRPNQSFTVILNDILYRVDLRTIQGLTYMSCWQEETLLFYNQLCTPNNFVNPYNYVSDNGKFYFQCLDNNYPNYELFNQTQGLVFYTPEEVEAMQ